MTTVRRPNPARYAVAGLALAAVLLSGTRCTAPEMTPERLLRMNIAVVTDREVDPLAGYFHHVLCRLLREPTGGSEAERPHLAWVRHQRAELQATVTRHSIAAWLGKHHSPDSDIEVAGVFEFAQLAGLVRFLGGQPEHIGVPVAAEVAGRYPAFDAYPVPVSRVKFVTVRAPVFFSALLYPAIRRRARLGRDYTVLELLEETGVVDRWAVGYVAARHRLYGTLFLRVRGLWLMWPVLTG